MEQVNPKLTKEEEKLLAGFDFDLCVKILKDNEKKINLMNVQTGLKELVDPTREVLLDIARVTILSLDPDGDGAAMSEYFVVVKSHDSITMFFTPTSKTEKTQASVPMKNESGDSLH